MKLDASEPPKVNERTSLESGSDIEIVATDVWFSATKIVEAILIEGESLTALIETLTSADEVLSPWVIV